MRIIFQFHNGGKEKRGRLSLYLNCYIIKVDTVWEVLAQGLARNQH